MNELRRARPAAVAGKFYPEQPEELRSVVAGFLTAEIQSPTPKIIIAPHAGYIYSGAAAGRVYSELVSARDQIARVIILATAHRTSDSGLIAPATDIFATPLGMLALDVFAINALASAGLCTKSATAHAEEHSVEVQLPFIQIAIGHCKIIPFVVGQCDESVVVDVLERLDADREDTIVVVSSDMSHYLTYDNAVVKDRQTAQMIENLNAEEISSDRMCGVYSVRGVLAYAKPRRFRAKTVVLCNSGDVSGSKDQVVGYGSFAFYPVN